MTNSDFHRSADSVELKPCPFCGEKQIFLNEPSQFYPYGSINCPACMATLPGAIKGKDQSELIDCWNARTVDDSGRHCAPGHVLMPQSQEEAKGMLLLAERYLWPDGRMPDVAQAVGMRAALERAQKIIDRDYPNGQIAIDIRDVLAARPPAAPVETGVSYEAMDAALKMGRPGIERMVEAIAKETGERIERHNGSSAGTDYVTVPVVPTEAMWGGLARDIIMWTRFDRPSQRSLLKHLASVGTQIPDWLAAECRDIDHVPPKGSVAAWVYRAMLDARPLNEPQAAQVTAAELQSGMDRQQWAENLILQLPVTHDGRDGWLLNYGRGEFARWLRRERGLSFNELSQAINPPAPQTVPDREHAAAILLTFWKEGKSPLAIADAILALSRPQSRTGEA